MKLRTFRALTKMTQQQLAQQLGISELSVIKYEQGDTTPSREQMLKIYRLSSGAVTPNDFYDLDSIEIEDSGFAGMGQDQAFLSLGLMSGSGFDSVDGCLLLTDGVGFLKVIGSESLQYEPVFRKLLACSEEAYRLSAGSAATAETALPAILSASADQSSFKDYLKVAQGSAISLRQIIECLTDLHIVLARRLIEKLGYKARAIDLVGFHGQTLYHAPREQLSIQVGDGQRMSDQLGICVVNDFRSNDIEHGGQGAPFAPLFHRALASQAQLTPAAIVNLGRVASVTMIGAREEDLYAFDAGPASLLIDRFVQERIGKDMDRDGAFGLQGQASPSVLQALCESALRTAQGDNYLHRTPPKSLTLSQVNLIPELDALSLQDGCATLAAFSAYCIGESLEYFLKSQDVPRLWILAGGSVANRALVQQITMTLRRKLGESVRVQSAEQVGWKGTALDAPIFAYLAVRSLLKLPLSLPGTTGVSEALSGGRCYLPNGNKMRVSKKVRRLLS
jgi:anhydro-N-acetylmuramic acid kinase